MRIAGLRWAEAAARATRRVAKIHTRQRTALRCYLRRLAPSVRPPPQPPKIDFVDNSRALANPAAGTISEKGRSRRRSVKNRRPFDCFKSAEGIRFSVVARPTPKSFHRGGFWRYLLAAQKVTYILISFCGSLNRAALRRRRTASPQPEICAENLKTSPENTKNSKKKHAICCTIQLFVLLLGQAIRRKRRESRCCFVNVRNLHPDSNNEDVPSGR